MKRTRTIQKKKQTPKPGRAIEKAKPGRTTVYIIGDGSIVAEYVSLCSSHGFSTVFDFNTPPETVPSFDSGLVRKSAQIPRDAAFALELTNVDLERKRRNIEMLDRVLPATTAIASSSVTIAATEQASWIKHKYRLVGCCALPTLGQRPLIEIAPTVFSPAGTVQVVQRFFQSLGKEIELVQDRVGMVFPRILCGIINEAAFALQDEIASPRDIDTAMRLGASWPVGPIVMADRIGLEQVYAVLAALHNDLGEDRYRVAPLLKQMAVSGTWWHRTLALSEERQPL
ncbi:MAG: 3-hydroxyacyl-CoA dehydrogenase family protein [Ignavibacteria bacterium]|nr:3-hydroxyacyl-CoA dehydrogenase family protein [Ignavibacteria bacterium]